MKTDQSARLAAKQTAPLSVYTDLTTAATKDISGGTQCASSRCLRPLLENKELSFGT